MYLRLVLMLLPNALVAIVVAGTSMLIFLIFFIFFLLEILHRMELEDMILPTSTRFKQTCRNDDISSIR